jgi:hypothetical protein
VGRGGRCPSGLGNTMRLGAATPAHERVGSAAPTLTKEPLVQRFSPPRTLTISSAESYFVETTLPKYRSAGTSFPDLVI